MELHDREQDSISRTLGENFRRKLGSFSPAGLFQICNLCTGQISERDSTNPLRFAVVFWRSAVQVSVVCQMFDGDNTTNLLEIMVNLSQFI